MAKDLKKAEEAIRQFLKYMGHDINREGLKETPRRYVKFMEEFCTPPEFKFTTFTNEKVDQMIIQKNIPFFSLCVWSNQFINTVNGSRPASSVKEGDELWTLDNGQVKKTKVTNITRRKTLELVEVKTEKGKFIVTPDHPVATPQGWVEAKDLMGKEVEWTPSSKLCRDHYIPKISYDLGYVIGAICSDGCVDTKRSTIVLAVTEKWFADKFCRSIKKVFGLEAKRHIRKTPSGRFKNPKYNKPTIVTEHQVVICSSYLADLFAFYVGGDPHHMRQKFPRVVLGSEKCMQGFIDAYVDGDGTPEKTGSIVTSGNKQFLQDFAQAVDAKFKGTPSYAGGYGPQYELYISDKWAKKGWHLKHGFEQESHRTTLLESRFVKVLNVKRIKQNKDAKKKFWVYSFKCKPYPTFLITGHLTHNCEHHLAPFFGTAAIAYIPNKNKIVGISKLARTLDLYSRRPQNQERIGTQVAERLQKELSPKGVAVVIKARHLCVEMRGVEKHDTWTITSAQTGCFKKELNARQEFLKLIEL